MKKIILLCCLAINVFAQTKSLKNTPPIAEATPESVGFSSERLQRMDAVLQDMITKNSLPGAAAIILKDGKIIYHKAFGMADNQANKSLKKDDIFRIASMTKAITSTAVMMLWEEGKFMLLNTFPSSRIQAS